MLNNIIFKIIIFATFFNVPIGAATTIQNQEEIMDYSIQIKDSVKIIGIALRTTNKNGESAKDILQFWQKFVQDGVLSRIPNKKGTDVFCLYTDYEHDYMSSYTVILGCEVENFEIIPEGMVSKTIIKSKYAVFKASGPEKVFSTWNKIWQTNLKRSYKTDFEVYKNAFLESNPAVDIFVGIQ